jgi:RHS repeat-associated protein
LTGAQYAYDGDGTLMRGTVNGTTTFYPGRHYNKEITNNVLKIQKFYFAGTLTIAVRTLENGTDVLNWILSDHLGSTSTTANADGSLKSIIQYTAFGEIRLTQGNTPTKYRYTGQLAQAEMGWDYYVARWYDPVLGHFTQADTIIPEPGKASAFDRYAYVLNNPVRYSDPSGHSDSGAYSPGENCEEEEEKVPPVCKPGEACKTPTPTPTPTSTSTPTYTPTSTQMPDSIMQVDLSNYHPKKQFDSDVYGPYKGMACGIVAGANGGASIDTVGTAALKQGYSVVKGIQPEKLFDAYKDVYGTEKVSGGNNNSIDNAFLHLMKGDIVIVDILINSKTLSPSDTGSTYAHFARIIGIDKKNQVVYIEDTLNYENDYWEVSFENFNRVWYYPEKNATTTFSNSSQTATNWAAYISH